MHAGFITSCGREFLHNALFPFSFFAVNASAVQTVGFEQEIAQSISNLLPRVTRFCLLCVPGEVLTYRLFFLGNPIPIVNGVGGDSR